jgi:hypothetical protein
LELPYLRCISTTSRTFPSVLRAALQTPGEIGPPVTSLLIRARAICSACGSEYD